MKTNIENLADSLQHMIYDDVDPSDIGFDFLEHDRRVDMSELNEDERLLSNAYRKALREVTTLFKCHISDRDKLIDNVTKKMLTLDDADLKIAKLQETYATRMETLEVIMDILIDAPPKLDGNRV